MKCLVVLIDPWNVQPEGNGAKNWVSYFEPDWNLNVNQSTGFMLVLTRESSAKRLPAVANYGLRPTVENQALLPRLEIHSIEELDHMEWKPNFLKWSFVILFDRKEI